MATNDFVRNAWYMAAWAEEVGDKCMSRRLLGEPVLMYRLSSGKAVALADRVVVFTARPGRVVERHSPRSHRGASRRMSSTSTPASITGPKRPSTSATMPSRSSSSITPDGVHATRVARCCTIRPTFTGLKPSTSFSGAMASNTPLRRYKQNTHGGGIRDPLVISWPKGLPARGELRHQFCHASDLTPTLLDVAGVKPPETINGIQQMPMEGTSFAASLKEANAPSKKAPQYFEMFGHRGLVKDGWKAVAFHPAGAPFDADRWELFHLDRDFSEAHGGSRATSCNVCHTTAPSSDTTKWPHQGQWKRR